MKRVLVDKKGDIVYEGANAKEILRILNADIYSVSEEDEFLHEPDYRKLLDSNGNSKYGELHYEVHFTLKFKGFDDWDRPVFKDIGSTLHFGSVNKLRKEEEDVVEYLIENPNELEYFGDKFNCEPHGGTQDFFKFNFVD